MSNSKDKDQEEKQVKPEPQKVIPVHDTQVQEPCTLEQAILNLGNEQPTTWSIIQ